VELNELRSVFGTRLSRRYFLGATAATSAAMLLAACGGDPDAEDDDDTAPTATTASGGGTSTEPSGGAATEPSGDASPTSGSDEGSSTPAGGASGELQGTGDAGEEPTPGGRLIIADAQADAPLDPFKTTWHSTAHFLVFTSYVDKDPDLEYVPYTFDSWEASADGKEITFTITPGITSTDGTPVNAESIKKQVDHYTDPELNSPGASGFGPLVSTEVVDEMTIKWTYESPYAPMLSGLSGREVISWDAYEKAGDDFTNQPVGPGPYKVKEQIAGNEIVYERNDDYAWAPAYYKNRGAGYFDEISIKIIKEDATIFAALQSGDIHAGAIPTVNVEDAKKNKDLTVVEQHDTGIPYLGMNSSKPPFEDPLVRQAISYAVDRDSIVANAHDGYGEVLYTPLSLAIKGSDNEGMKAISYLYDPEKGRATMEEAGWDLSGDVATKDGEKFEVELMINNADFWKRAAQIIQQQLKEIGIKINIQLMEGTALNDATTTGNHEMFLQLYGSTDASILFYFIHSSRKGATNRAWYSTPELDAILEEAQSTLDLDKQEELYHQVQEMVVKASPWVILANPYEFIGIRNEVRNLKMHPQGGYLLHDAWLKQ
jgi:peptide/nickel transport system substrate-binding protein